MNLLVNAGCVISIGYTVVAVYRLCANRYVRRMHTHTSVRTIAFVSVGDYMLQVLPYYSLVLPLIITMFLPVNKKCLFLLIERVCTCW